MHWGRIIGELSHNVILCNFANLKIIDSVQKFDLEEFQELFFCPNLLTIPLQLWKLSWFGLALYGQFMLDKNLQSSLTVIPNHLKHPCKHRDLNQVAIDWECQTHGTGGLKVILFTDIYKITGGVQAPILYKAKCNKMWSTYTVEYTVSISKIKLTPKVAIIGKLDESW